MCGAIYGVLKDKIRININTDDDLTLTEPLELLFMLLENIGGGGACARPAPGALTGLLSSTGLKM